MPEKVSLRIWWNEDREPTDLTVVAHNSTPGGLAYIEFGEDKWTLVPWHRIYEVERSIAASEVERVWPRTNET